MSYAVLPEEVFIEVPRAPTGREPFLLRFMESPGFDKETAATLRASRVSSVQTTGGNDVLDYDYED